MLVKPLGAGLSSTNRVLVWRLSTILTCFYDVLIFSVFAYGAMGAGKTFTMLENAQNPGVIFLTMMDLLTGVQSVHQ